MCDNLYFLIINEYYVSFIGLEVDIILTLIFKKVFVQNIVSATANIENDKTSQKIKTITKRYTLLPNRLQLNIQFDPDKASLYQVCLE